MSNLPTFETLFDNRVRKSDAQFTTAQRQDALQEAFRRHAQHAPQELAEDYDGDDATFDLPLPPSWDDGVSIINHIEYPAGERVPSILLRNQWIWYQTPTGKVIRLLTVTPATGKSVRIPYTAPHVVDADSSTIAPNNEEAVADLAAAYGLRQMAATYANTVNPTIEADAIDYRSKAREYTELADRLNKQYNEHMGIDADRVVQPGQTFVQTRNRTTVGTRWLTHTSRM